MRIVFRLLISLLLLCSGTVASSPGRTDPTDDRIDEYVQGQMRKQRIPGLALAALRNGEIVKARGYGLANVELNVAVTPQTIFQSGSMGKQFTAAVVMLLVEEGKLTLDDRILKYVDGAPETWKDVRVRHLLTHTSGIKEYEGDNFIDLRRDYTESDLVKTFAQFPLDFAPGEKFSYSNAGYVLLGIIIRKVTGQFYGDVLQDRVFKPLGMNTARVISEADIIPNRAAGYRLVNGELKNQDWVSPALNTTADGALYFTVLDLAKWDAALHANRLFKRETLDRIWTPVTLNNGNSFPYGFGWRIDVFRGHAIIGHGGSWQGFRTYIERYVEDKLTVIALANLAEADPDTIVHGVAGLYNPAYLPPSMIEAQPDPDAALTARLREFLSDFSVGNDRDTAMAVPGLLATLSDTARRETARRIQDGRSFTFIACDDVRARKIVRGGAEVSRLCHYKLATPREAHYYTFALTSDHKVAEFSSYID